VAADAAPESLTRAADGPGAAVYAHRNERLGIDFEVDRLAFPGLQTLDPRVLRIAPGRNNERHRHAHETLFVVLSGHGEVHLGEAVRPVRAGDVAFVPRWIFHQTRNGSETEPLVILAITDFGFTSALLGDYDRRTRLAASGDDAVPAAP
jgi:quercetin dioxygenase-like cupin family protein